MSEDFEDLEELNADELWMVAENLIESYYSLEDMNHPNAEAIGSLLDKLSPNWREAESDADVKINPIFVKEAGESE